jgi:hypothetical protein
MIKTGVRRLLTAGAATVAVMVFGAGPASAHFCYFTEPNVQAELGRAGSQGFVSFGDLAAEITGLCPAGVEILAGAAGVTTGTLINAHGLMAGGTLKKGPEASPKPISHLDFDAIEAAFPTAVAACGG